MTSSTSTKPNPSILLVGLPPDHPLVPAEVRDKVKAGMEQTRKNAATVGVDLQPLTIAPEEIPALVTALQSKQWDGMVIGNGVRSNMQLTHFMEEMIAALMEHAPQARLMFNTGADTVLEAIRRWFPEVKQM